MDDAKYVALAKAIAKKESNNNPNTYGDNNTSYGLGQWNNLGKPLAKGELPAVWKEHAGIVLGDSNAPMTELNQKAVLTGMVKKWATEDKLQPFEIAAKWNSGSAQGWENKAGTTIVNGKSLTYNTPAYVKEVDSIFKKFLAQIPQQEPVQKPAGYDIPERILSQEEKQANLLNAQQQAEAMGKKAKRAKSPLGFLANVGVGIGETLASSQIGLGKTIGKTMSSKNLEGYTQNIDNLVQSNIQTAQKIKEFEAQGKDATNLKRAFNENLKVIEENKKAIGGYQESLPTSGQVIGQFAGTGLDIVTAGQGSKATAGMKSFRLATTGTSVIQGAGIATGLPEVSQMAGQKASGLFTKQGTKNILKGAGVGYASDVSQGLQGMRGEDRTGGKAFIPGLGTAIGGGIPTVAEAVKTGKNLLNPEFKINKIIEKRKEGLNKLDQYQSIKKATEKGRERGIDIKKILAETDVLEGSVDKTGTITTKGDGGAVEQYTKQFIDGNESIVSDLLKKENRSISPTVIKAKLLEKVKNAGIEGKAYTQAIKNIDDEIAGYLLKAGNNDTIPVSVLHDAKIDKYNNINFFTEGNTKKYDKTVANALKELVEENTTSIDVKKVNNELSKHFAVIDYLNKLDNKKVQGGKLGKYFAQTVGAIVGSNAGPLGAIVGAEVGGNIKGNIMSKAFSGKTGKIQPQSEIITEALRIKNAPSLELPQSKSNNLGSLNTNQSTTIAPTKNVIPKSIAPKNKNARTLPKKSK